MPNGRLPTGIDGLSSSTGWFPLECTKVATAEQLQQLQKLLGGGSEASDALKPPSSWATLKDPMTPELFTLPEGGEKSQAVSAFRATLQHIPSLQVLSVERVQNVSMWQSYAVKRQTIVMREQGDEATLKKKYERVWLFHGTNEDTIPKIITQGFNRSFAGKNMTMYGKGVYFARDSDYSARKTYAIPNAAGVQSMFLCRVTVGEFCPGKKDAITPDVRQGYQLYDSTVNDMNSPQIYVTYHDAQAFPEYLIKFKQ